MQIRKLNQIRQAAGIGSSILLAIAIGAPAAASQRGGQQEPGSDLLRQATQQIRDGHEAEAVATARKAVAEAPESYRANVTLGNVLDFAGQYDEARKSFQKAADIAPEGQNEDRALRAIAISYGFQANCPNVIRYEKPLYEQYLAAKDFYNAGEVANELARLCLDAGSIDTAEEWYRKGTEAGLQEPGIKPERTDLWHYRLEHALARVAARRGKKDEADKHVAAAKALLDRGNMPEQQKEYFPYLEGYVALFTGDPQAALTSLKQANQTDAYVLGLEAQAYEKLGQTNTAKEYYRKVLRSTTHNPTTAGSRPLAKKKIANGK